jgi:ribosomal protein S18 acetylase RimI-like enzyme
VIVGPASCLVIAFAAERFLDRADEFRWNVEPSAVSWCPVHVTATAILYHESRELPNDDVLALYRANGWSAAQKPELLRKALANSHSLVSAWDGERLVGLGNAISDGHLVVYFPHLVVLPEYQGQGIGTRLMHLLMARYEGFHQQVVVADGRAVEFYRQLGFTRAGGTEPMWVYAGQDH